MYIHNYNITLESFFRCSFINEGFKETNICVQNSVLRWHIFLLRFTFYFLCLIDNYRHNICKVQKQPSLNCSTTGPNYTYMSKFLKK